MATHPRFDSDDSESASSERQNAAQIRAAKALVGLDLAELRAQLKARSGGASPEISANLALEIVLNEVVEQACLATGASGAAIALERDNEWICRASAGANAPQLGARLDAEAGLSGACIHTRQVQRCNDAQDDTRVDAEACRSLGVLSVIVFPLLLNGELAGVFELFSRSRSAFGERDERTLEAFSHRVLRVLEQSSNPPLASQMTAEVESLTEPSVEASESIAAESSDSQPDPVSSATTLLQARSDESAPAQGIQFLTWLLTAAVLVAAILLTVTVAQRFVGRKATNHSRRTLNASARVQRSATSGTNTGSSVEAGNNRPAVSGSAPTTAPAPAGLTESSSPPGGLLVYENGKEVFRMPVAAEPNGSRKAANKRRNGGADLTENQPSPIVRPAGIYELSPEAAEGILLLRAEPDYPEDARLKQIEGPVVLEVRAAGDGSVQQVDLVSGQPLLASAAIAAVKQWRFKPHRVKGHPVAMQLKVTLNFKLPATSNDPH